MIQFSQITATNCALTKTFKRDASGQIESSAVAHMTEGHARVLDVADVSKLPALLDALGPNQAITVGVPASGEAAALTTRAGSEYRADAIARTNESFRYPYGACLFPFDVDVDGDRFQTVENVLDALESCHPWLAHVLRFAKPSSSSYVGGRGLRGVHVYIGITSGGDTEALKKRVKIEQWEKDQGYVKISKSGALLTRQLSDDLVYQPSRLLFESLPVLDGVERVIPDGQRCVVRAPNIAAGHPVKYKTADGLLDVQALPAIRAIAERRVATQQKDAKTAKLPEAKRVAIQYQTANAIANGYDAKEGERLGLLAIRALGDNALPPSWLIQVKDIGPVTVAQILENLDSALGLQCCCPFDTSRPDLQPKHFTKAEIVMHNSEPGIWSHKLGKFIKFTANTSADLSSPLEQAAEKLCDMIEYPEPLDKKAASELNVAHALGLLLDEAEVSVRYNESTYAVEGDAIPDALKLKYALARVGCLRVSKATLETAIGDVARAAPFDPWKMTILSLPVWDKVPRLDSFFTDTFGALPSTALTATAQVFFASIIMRQLQPGAAAPVIPVLIGDQGVGKTQFVHQLAAALGAPQPAAITFGDAIKMSMEASLSIIAELSEMSGMGRREAEEIKSWTTATDDVYRAPYERKAEHHPRRFVLIGTANKNELNRDETGNRRFMPIEALQPLDREWSREVHQVLAEAKQRFCYAEAYERLCRTAADAVREHNAADMRVGKGTVLSDLDDLLPPIVRHLHLASSNRRVMSSDIRKALDTSPSGRTFSAQKVAQWLRMRGWTPGTDGHGMRYYEAPTNYLDESSNIDQHTNNNPFTTTEKTA